MCRKGGYTNLTSSLNEDYLARSVASFMACGRYDETICVINASKGYVSYSKQNLQQQLVKNNTGAKRFLVVDDEYDINLTLKVVLEDSGFTLSCLIHLQILWQHYKILKVVYMIWLWLTLKCLECMGLVYAMKLGNLTSPQKIPIMNLLGSKHILTMKKIASFGS